MNLKAGSALYVRIDYKVKGKTESEQDIMDSMAYLQSLTQERNFLVGIFGDMEQMQEHAEHEISDTDGIAMALFEAESLEEAKEISNKDPLIERGFYRCQVQKWNIMISSKG